MKIITNHVPRDLIYGYELSDAEKEDFDYLDDIDSHDFFRYRGVVYDPSEFMVWDNPESPMRDYWDGFRCDSYFSGVVIKYVDNYERVIVGLVLS